MLFFQYFLSLSVSLYLSTVLLLSFLTCLCDALVEMLYLSKFTDEKLMLVFEQLITNLILLVLIDAFEESSLFIHLIINI